MIRLVTGDILLSKAHAIAHGVAPNDPHAQGLAHALREQWPAMYKDFRHFCQTRHPESGTAWTWSGTGDTHLISLFTQEGSYDHGGKPGKAKVAHVNHALRALAHEIEREGYTSVALPRLATGVGGLEWDEVLPLIETQLGKLDIPVLIYSVYKPGVAADEGLPRKAA